MRKCSHGLLPSTAAMPIRNTFVSCTVWSTFFCNKHTVVLETYYHDTPGFFSHCWPDSHVWIHDCGGGNHKRYLGTFGRGNDMDWWLWSGIGHGDGCISLDVLSFLGFISQVLIIIQTVSRQHLGFLFPSSFLFVFDTASFSSLVADLICNNDRRAEDSQGVTTNQSTVSFGLFYPSFLLAPFCGFVY